MPKSIGPLGRQMKACLWAHMSAWFHSLRTILMFVFVLCIVYMLTRSWENMLRTSNYTAYMGETLFCYLRTGFNMNVTSAVLLVMVSEIPKRSSYQEYMLMRTSQMKWLLSLLLFCVVVVVLMLLLLLAASALMTLPFVSTGSGWSDLERLALNPDYEYEMQLCPPYARQLTPLVACLCAGSILFFFWVTMLFVILLFSLYGKPNIGLLLYIFIILSPITIFTEFIAGMKTPMHFSTMAAIASQFPERELQSIPYVLAVYIAIDIVLVGLMVFRVRQTDLCFSGKGGAF